MKRLRTILGVGTVVLTIAATGCDPEGPELGEEDPGSAAPDLTSETSPPPVPPPPGDTAALEEVEP